MMLTENQKDLIALMLTYDYLKNNDEPVIETYERIRKEVDNEAVALAIARRDQLLQEVLEEFNK